MDVKARDLFRKLIGKLGSDQDGERASAANLCTRLLLRHRLTWADVVAGKVEGGENTDRTFDQDYIRGYEDGFQKGVRWQGNRVKPIKSFLRTAITLWVMSARRSVLLSESRLKNRST